MVWNDIEENKEIRGIKTWINGIYDLKLSD